MSDPTRPQGTSGDPEGDGDRGANAENAGPTGGHSAEDALDQGAAGERLQAKAYVDPSIAAEARLLELEAEVADYKDRFLRAHAEMDNLRKRSEREKADAAKYSISRFAGDMLGVADNLQRALDAVTASGEEPPAAAKPLIDGIELTGSELQKALERNGITKLEALGQIFDPNVHQAVMQEENKDVAEGTVLNVFQDGYQIGERVLRPAMVVVARGGPKPEKVPEKAEMPTGTPANDDTPPDDQSGPEGPREGGPA